MNIIACHPTGHERDRAERGSAHRGRDGRGDQRAGHGERLRQGQDGATTAATAGLPRPRANA